MNRKIKRMIIELEKECKEQNVELLLCAANFETDQGSTAFCGSVIGLTILLQKLLGDLKEQLSISESCDCPECVAERAEDATNEKSMDELLTAFLRGDLR
ncbi:TPA: hypothetical protein RD661_001149 [Enterococcus faecalis]|nr:hypothetical protein [Enterococcus faecalis]